ncbi:MAG TPA: tetratricopeptide repeat protein [Verrucomicrobiae bacterium]|nr:tetratricopeptide repeat protein [Verrucomicrobiae bacterium]
MGQILKFPVRASKFGYKRVPKRVRNENPAQLHLFPSPTAQVLRLETGLSHFEHALLMDERGELQAIDLYQKAIAEQDCIADAYCNLGIIESQRGQTAKAFDCFTNSLKQDPRHLEAHYNLGNMYFEVNDFRLAQIHYEIAAELDPSFPNVHFNLALVRSLNHEFAAAIAALGRYQSMVSPAEARNADELLQSLKKSLTTNQQPSRTRAP